MGTCIHLLLTIDSQFSPLSTPLLLKIQRMDLLLVIDSRFVPLSAPLFSKIQKNDFSLSAYWNNIGRLLAIDSRFTPLSAPLSLKIQRMDLFLAIDLQTHTSVRTSIVKNSKERLFS